MKKKLLMAAWALIAVSVNVYSQTDDRIDSLYEEINKLKARVENTEKEQLNDQIWANRKRYFNIAYGIQTLTHQEQEDLQWRSKWAAAIVKGTTYYLHRKPIAGMIKFGLDWTQIDLHVANYQTDFGGQYTPRPSIDGFSEFNYEDDYDNDFGLWQMEASMHIGPSVTINPVSHLKVNAYFRYAPSFSAIYLDDNFNYNYATFFVTGAAVSYKTISLGWERRWGSAKYKSIELDDLSHSEERDVANVLAHSDNKLKTSGMRVYLSFRF